MKQRQKSNFIRRSKRLMPNKDILLNKNQNVKESSISQTLSTKPHTRAYLSKTGDYSARKLEEKVLNNPIKSNATNEDLPEFVWEFWDDGKDEMCSNNTDTRSKINKMDAKDVSITLGKSFLYNSAFGWNWHKSWNIPTIFVNINPLKSSPLNKLKVILKGIIFRAESYNKRNIGDVKLNGILNQDVINGQAVFSKITFASTSFQNHGSKFHLMISFMDNQSDEQENLPKILHSYISPPIFVDAKNRKKETQKISISEKLSIRFFSPFNPKLLKSSFIRKKKFIGRSNTFNIENSLRGLYEYLSATHIRFKTKHPLFLVMKFSNPLKLLYNIELQQEYLLKRPEKSLEEFLIQKFQRYLDHVENRLNNPNVNPSNDSLSSSFNTELTKKHFIILIDEPKSADCFSLTKTIYQNFEYIKHELLHFTFIHNTIPVNFVNVPAHDLEMAYTSCYYNLINKKSQSKTIQDTTSNVLQSMTKKEKRSNLDRQELEPRKVKKICMENSLKSTSAYSSDCNRVVKEEEIGMMTESSAMSSRMLNPLATVASMTQPGYPKRNIWGDITGIKVNMPLNEYPSSMVSLPKTATIPNASLGTIGLDNSLTGTQVLLGNKPSNENIRDSLLAMSILNNSNGNVGLPLNLPLLCHTNNNPLLQNQLAKLSLMMNNQMNNNNIPIDIVNKLLSSNTTNSNSNTNTNMGSIMTMMNNNTINNTNNNSNDPTKIQIQYKPMFNEYINTNPNDISIYNRSMDLIQHLSHQRNLYNSLSNMMIMPIKNNENAI